jgi:hypothetical protein
MLTIVILFISYIILNKFCCSQLVKTFSDYQQIGLNTMSTIGHPLKPFFPNQATDSLRLYNFSTGTNVLNESYVCFFQGSNYWPRVQRVIKSVHLFSSKPVVVFAAGRDTLDFDYSSYPRAILLRVEEETRHPWFLKLRASILAPVLLGVIIESDSLVWNGADLLFEILRMETLADNYSFPLLTRHPDTRSPSRDESTYNVFPYPTKSRTTSYGHAHLSWSYLAIPF